MNQQKRKIGIIDYIAFACVSAVGILPQYLLSSFASAYYTDVALVSAGAIGTVILVMRVTDGISDLIMGRVIDRTNTKWGKCRPWMLIGSIGLVFTSLMIFHAPGAWSESMKIAWFAVSYFLMMVVFATIQGVAGQTMMVYVTHVPQERNTFGAFSMAGTYFGGIIATTVTTVLLGIWGYTQSGYDKTVLMYVPFLLVLGIFSVVRLREEASLSSGADRKEEKKAPIKAVLKAMGKNKYYLSAVAAGLLINLINGIVTSMGVYFCRDIFNNSGMYALLTLATIFPTLLGLPVAVKMAQKLGNYKTLAYGRVAYMITMVISAVGLFTSNPSLYLGAQILAGFCGATFAACFTATLANTIDYSEYHYPTGSAGMMMSATSFCNKVGLGLGSAVTGIILTIAKYDGALASADLAQSLYTIETERWAMIIVPFVLNFIVTALLFNCNIDKEMPEIHAALNKEQK